MIGVLIGAIMITGGMTVIGQIDKAKVENEVRELARFKKKTSSILTQRGTSVGTNLQTAITLGFFDPAMVAGAPGARSVRNQWGGTIDVIEATVTNFGDALAFRYTGVSTAACKQLGMQAGSVASVITVQGTTMKSTVTAIPILAGPSNVNQAALIAHCDFGANNVTIEFFLTK